MPEMIPTHWDAAGTVDGWTGRTALDLIEVAAHVSDRLGDEVADAKVEQVVVEKAADEELDREIIDAYPAAVASRSGVTPSKYLMHMLVEREIRLPQLLARSAL